MRWLHESVVVIDLLADVVDRQGERTWYRAGFGEGPSEPLLQLRAVDMKGFSPTLDGQVLGFASVRLVQGCQEKLNPEHRVSLPGC